MTPIRFTSVAVAHTLDDKHARWFSHVVAIDTKGRAWERFGGLGEANGWALIRSPEEPAKRETTRAKRKRPNAK